MVQSANRLKLAVSNHWTGLWTGLLNWTDGLDLICLYHMTSIQSNVVNLVISLL